MTTCTANQTDRQLLDRFASRRDEEAFAQLVHRHGPLVLGVCRQILRHEQDAEDAFQATFLVLSRKADSIRSAEALPNWLYGVAHRLATRMKAAAWRRQTREGALVQPPLSEPGPDGEAGDLGPILFEEIGRLPDKCRLAFILCYLEGKTNEQAAQQLGCPPGTVFSRLARARELLRLQLARRGLALSSAALAAALLNLPAQASAAVPQQLEATTVQEALQFSSGKLGSASNIPARVVYLATWGVRSLSRRGFWTAGALLVLLILMGTLGGLFLRHRPAPLPIHERLQGTWTVISMNQGGFEIPGAQAQLTFKDDQMTLSDTPGTFRIDAEKDPMQIDWTIQGRVSHGIFKLQGDELTLCFMAQSPDDPPAQLTRRPADFSPQPGKSVAIFKPLRH
jgi:RNA polymerase sigma factor (sigma-70 family)